MSDRQLDIAGQLAAWQARVESALERRMPPAERAPARLHAAMRYSVFGPGKRIRPALVYATAACFGGQAAHLDAAACAVELIHAYSLVHDDLPAMDDDDLRRGRPTCHKAFDEATAILVGDALQTLAFDVLVSDAEHDGNAATQLHLVQLLAQASGSAGMAGGQALDLAATGQQLTLDAIETMHGRKTGALIRASVLMGAVCAHADAAALTALDRFATHLGLAFQIQDDLLDVEGDPQLLGKATGADHALAKSTYPAVAGLPAARERMHRLHEYALQALHSLSVASAPLAALCDWLVLRRY